jgi:hypothetical protein
MNSVESMIRSRNLNNYLYAASCVVGVVAGCYFLTRSTKSNLAQDEAIAPSAERGLLHEKFSVKKLGAKDGKEIDVLVIGYFTIFQKNNCFSEFIVSYLVPVWEVYLVLLCYRD